DAADPESEDITPPLPSESALEVSSEQQERQQTPTRSNTKKAKPTVKDAPPKTVDVMLAWDDVPNAISYNIYWSDKPGVTIKNGTKISNVKSPHKISGLIKGKKYYFVVTAVNASVESEESEEMSFTVGQ
ncbi:MAG: fibronectin type III domain-containing protein, partial [Desulfobacterales bacterium]